MGSETKRSGFAGLWLAETLRVINSVNADWLSQKAVSQVRAATPDNAPQTLAVNWSLSVAERDGLLQDQLRWQRRAVLFLMIGLLLSLLAGFTGTITMLDSQQSVVNIPWSLSAILGIHFLMLLIWIISLFIRSDGAWSGRLLLSLLARLRGHHGAELAQGFITLSQRNKLMPWWLGSVSQLVWLAGLLGSVLALLTAFSFQYYSFSWETTLLPGSVLQWLQESLSWLPQMLGVSSDTLTLADNGSDLADEARRAWASWMIVVVVMYGLLPRLLALAVCWLVLTFRLRLTKLDLSHPYWQRVLGICLPTATGGRITDPAPEALVSARFTRPEGIFDGPDAAVRFELDASQQLDSLTLPAEQVREVDTRVEREEELHWLKATRPNKLLILCESGHSPDRGTLRWLTRAGECAGVLGIFLMPPQTGQQDRRAIWRQLLTEAELPEEQVMTDWHQVRQWLKPEAGSPSWQGESQGNV